MEYTDSQLLQMTAAGRQTLARRVDAADSPATFATTIHSAAADRGRKDGTLDGTRAYHMGDAALEDVMMDVHARAAFTKTGAAISDPSQAAYTSTYAQAHRAAYRAAQAKGKPQGPAGDPEDRRRLLTMTPLGRSVLAKEAKG